jgi:hypothetical protein
MIREDASSLAGKNGGPADGCLCQLDVYRLAVADARGEGPDPALKAQRDHLAGCDHCRKAYESAKWAYRRMVLSADEAAIAGHAEEADDGLLAELDRVLEDASGAEAKRLPPPGADSLAEMLAAGAVEFRQGRVFAAVAGGCLVLFFRRLHGDWASRCRLTVQGRTARETALLEVGGRDLAEWSDRGDLHVLIEPSGDEFLIPAAWRDYAASYVAAVPLAESCAGAEEALRSFEGAAQARTLGRMKMVPLAEHSGGPVEAVSRREGKESPAGEELVALPRAGECEVPMFASRNSAEPQRSVHGQVLHPLQCRPCGGGVSLFAHYRFDDVGDGTYELVFLVAGRPLARVPVVGGHAELWGPCLPQAVEAGAIEAAHVSVRLVRVGLPKADRRGEDGLRCGEVLGMVREWAAAFDQLNSRFQESMAITKYETIAKCIGEPCGGGSSRFQSAAAAVTSRIADFDNRDGAVLLP